MAVEVEVAAAAALGIGQSGSDARVLVRAAADARPDQNLAPKHIVPDGAICLDITKDAFVTSTDDQDGTVIDASAPFSS